MIIEDKLREMYYKYFFTDRKRIESTYKKRLGREVNIFSPKRFTDKLQWLKLYWYDPLAVKCADKYEVRSYIKEKIGESYLNDLLGVYNSVREIDIDKLPNQFVLKGTHGSGFNFICKDKNSVDWDRYAKLKNVG